jgi:hypothetical protein
METYYRLSFIAEGCGEDGRDYFPKHDFESLEELIRYVKDSLAKRDNTKGDDEYHSITDIKVTKFVETDLDESTQEAIDIMAKARITYTQKEQEEKLKEAELARQREIKTLEYRISTENIEQAKKRLEELKGG